MRDGGADDDDEGDSWLGLGAGDRARRRAGVVDEVRIDEEGRVVIRVDGDEDDEAGGAFGDSDDEDSDDLDSMSGDDSDSDSDSDSDDDGARRGGGRRAGGRPAPAAARRGPKNALAELERAGRGVYGIGDEAGDAAAKRRAAAAAAGGRDAKRGRTGPGGEFRSRKAGGGMRRSDKPEPYAYVPLSSGTLSKRRKGKAQAQSATFGKLVRGGKGGKSRHTVGVATQRKRFAPSN